MHQATWKRYTGQGPQPRSLEVWDPPMDMPWFNSLESPQTLSFWVFMETSLHRHDWLNHWPLVISLQILCPPWGQGWDRTEKSTPIIMVCSPGHQPHPEGLSKGYLINISPGLVERGLVMNNKAPVSPLRLRNIFRNWGQETKYFNRRSCHCSYHSEIPRIWGAVSLEAGTKTKIYIYYKWDFSCTSGCTISVYLQT